MIRRPTLAALLAGAGLDPDPARDALRAHDDEGGESPWAIRILVGVGAWIAAIVLLVFAVLLDLATEQTALFTGTVSIAAAVALRRTADRASVFRSQFALSLGFAGHGVLLVHIGDDGGIIAAALTALVLGVAMLFAMPDPVHRFASTALAGAGLLVAVYEATESPTALELAAAVLVLLFAGAFEYEVRWQRSRWADLQLPVGYGLAAGLAAGLLAMSLGELPRAPVVGAALAGALGALAFVTARELGAGRGGGRSVGAIVGGLALVVALLALVHQAPGIVAALLGMALGLRRAHPVLFGASVLFLVYFLGAWYYQMELTLFAKAAALALPGLGLLAARGLLRARRPAETTP